MTSNLKPKSLISKLGIRPGMTVMIEDPPDDYDKLLGIIPESVKLINELSGQIDCLQAFFRTRQEFEDHFLDICSGLKPNGMVWVCWIKQSSKKIVDPLFDENFIRNLAPTHDMVDIKVCAIDENWSGLKLVRRVSKR